MLPTFACSSGESRIESALKEETAQKNEEIVGLKAELKSTEVEKLLSVKDAVTSVGKERGDLARNLETEATEQKLRESALKVAHAAELKAKDGQIAYYKDFKAKLSTKSSAKPLSSIARLSSTV